MSNEKVIRAFFRKEVAKTPLRDIQNGCFTYKGRTLEVKITHSEDGDIVDLINYSTIIASIVNGRLYVNNKKYSSTTSKLQTMIKRLAEEYGYSNIGNLNVEEVR